MAAQTRTPAGTDWTTRLRTAGLRVTQPRLAVLDVVSSTPHISADAVTDRVRDRLGTVSVQAVYDALNTLTKHDILRKFEPAGSSMRFEVHTGDNHHHLICRRCGDIIDVACSVGAMPCALPDDPHGFVVDEAEVTYWGVCSSCRTYG
ncbi:Fur family ferric uptake transcriptional regulator [Friedmanniella endophytica]|uniref:Fur family ferric uptake transcriptional regulator n=1 Tax=Microlunatus kandeliicorticis TaxID=1759536 RepID=A0A7W3P5X4_9ACTN|nr:Fur family transcriptional regulator [Microlunatus kandeliicorticis]MBA8794446.1 Fur family ferric uptake transcriptional regulator [Microlunatus kandeliicorticis]